MRIPSTLCEMSLEQLVWRARWHEELALVYENNNEPGTGKKFRDLANQYRAEIDGRPTVGNRPS